MCSMTARTGHPVDRNIAMQTATGDELQPDIVQDSAVQKCKEGDEERRNVRQEIGRRP